MSTFSPFVVIAWICCCPVWGNIAKAGEFTKVSAPLAQVVTQAVEPVMSQYQIPGIAIAVSDHGNAHFFNFGMASIASQQAVTEHTLFELGSVSKTFNALLAGYAIAQGKLDLTAHPSRYWPALKGTDIDKATMLQLATYSAGGLPLQFPSDVGDDAEMLHYFRQWQASAAPGAVRQYSNPSIALFGYLVSRALGQEYRWLIETELLPHLGLSHTYIDVPNAALKDYAWGYNRKMKPVRVTPGVLDAEAYGVKSTAADMLQYLQLQMDSRHLPDTLQHAMAATHVGYYQLGDMQQGLGWEQYQFPLTKQTLLAGNASDVILHPHDVTPVTQAFQGEVLFNKTGSTAGFGAYLAFVPQRQLGIVILANRYYPNTARVDIATAIMDVLVSNENSSMK